MKEVKTSRIFRLIPFLLCAILIAGMTACGDDDEKDVPIGPNGPAPDFAIDFPDSIRIPATGDTLSGKILCDPEYIGPGTCSKASISTLSAKPISLIGYNWIY